MDPAKIYNVNIISEKLLPTPREVISAFPCSSRAEATVYQARLTIENILRRTDPRLLVIVGPCSIHDLQAASEYAENLATLSRKVSDTLFLVMRVYFEKPRTTIGWKGFINDPYLDDSFRIDEGLYKAREFLLKLAELGLPGGTETLDPITPQYLCDLISWSAIGARTTESQTHREIASGLSTPIGFKNGTDGSIEVAINALRSVQHSHHFLGITQDGRCAVFHTKGNRNAHIVLRGGSRPNYDSVSISLCERELEKAGLPVNIVVDCSHGNSLKDPTLQPLILQNVTNQIIEGNKSIVGVMLESNLAFGSQEISTPSQLRYGVSITDGCIDWATTEKTLLEAREALRTPLQARGNI